MAGGMDLAVADTGVREFGVVTEVNELEVVDGVSVSTPDDDELVVTVFVVEVVILVVPLERDDAMLVVVVVMAVEPALLFVE